MQNNFFLKIQDGGQDGRSNSSKLKLDCWYGELLANPKLLACQSLIFYVQPFGKSMGGGRGGRGSKWHPPWLIWYST